MRWLGVGLMIVSALVGLGGWYMFSGNQPAAVGAAVFFVIGLIVFLASHERKVSEKIEDVHTDKKE
jgi:hypothetical protein